jgi:uncharacterized DUF497 family protein
MTPVPSHAEAREWDEGNERELAGHGIAPAEVLEVWANRPIWVPNARHRSGDWKMCGTTYSWRRLTIVVRYPADRGAIRPITGWDTTRGERSRYFKGA